jgi:hypothetical protein
MNGMKTALILISVVLLAGLAMFGLRRIVRSVSETSSSTTVSAEETHPPAAEVQPGFLYGRVTTAEGVTYEGRLRWGSEGGQEAFWGDYFNGFKPGNSWAAYVPRERLKDRRPIEIFGVEIAHRERPIDLGRPFVARFGDITRIERRGDDVRVTLKSGTAFDLNRFDASDFDDGVWVWDEKRGAVGLDSLRIRSIELLPAARPVAALVRLHGTLHTRQGDFTGFVQWDREECVGSDELVGDELSVRFDTLRSIARRSRDSALVTLLDGREITLSIRHGDNPGNRGTFVDDPRYGRVLVSWDGFQRLDFSPGDGSGPAYGDFPPGRPLTGSVTTRAGRRLAGRLVYDLDESETTETLDAPSKGVDYTIPFGLIASIILPGGEEHAWVILQNGEKLQLERAGDLGERNGGLLVFGGGRERAEHVPWTDVGQIDLDRPPTMHSPPGGR